MRRKGKQKKEKKGFKGKGRKDKKWRQEGRGKGGRVEKWKVIQCKLLIEMTAK